LGEKITISDFDDAILKIKVAARTQMGTKIRLKGKGFPVYKKEGQFGNLYINY
jgi:curved DNA-binding protein